MKWNKLINSLKKYWWRIVSYIFMINIFFISFLKLEINDLKLLYEKFEALISLMILGYLDIYVHDNSCNYKLWYWMTY